MRRVPHSKGPRDSQKPFKGSRGSTTPKRPGRRAIWKWITLFVALGFGGLALAHFGTNRSTPLSFSVPAQMLVGTAPRTLSELLALAPDTLQTSDIALLNLLCAEGLRGSAGLNVRENLKLLDGLTTYVERETNQGRKTEDIRRLHGGKRLSCSSVIYESLLTRLLS